jgi:DNA-binding response OmpR family regulator
MRSILLVEDDSGMANLLQILFDIEGITSFIPIDFRIESITDQIINNSPDVILMDVNLKQNNGLDVLKYLKENKILNQDTIVIMSSGSDLKDKCMDAGANLFLQKPYMPDELLRMIKN